MEPHATGGGEGGEGGCRLAFIIHYSRGGSSSEKTRGSRREDREGVCLGDSVWRRGLRRGYAAAAGANVGGGGEDGAGYGGSRSSSPSGSTAAPPTPGGTSLLSKALASLLRSGGG
ncbi:hypothetical protein GUJ93_ZPchr0008g12427 [Zizania palustris]|uniref:Uncharacterized protein n=1 Tax=Zizania palustris TaxID=103762 RepID=A0A8J5RFP1_ZIZPA|nr:hypothetical protein GUJ93_ZPchr0008g12427 [Zizania palustris]